MFELFVFVLLCFIGATLVSIRCAIYSFVEKEKVTSLHEIKVQLNQMKNSLENIENYQWVKLTPEEMASLREMQEMKRKLLERSKYQSGKITASGGFLEFSKKYS